MAYEVRIVADMSRVDPAAWNALCDFDTPFLDHAFLRLLETSRCVGEGTGWRPRHLLALRDGALVGGLPCYERWDSLGEFIWDFAWAQGAERAGIPYYPKLTCSVPFTPATGPRLLVARGEDRDAVRRSLGRAFRELCREQGASSAHVLFCLDREAELLRDEGFMRRATHQYHWRNDGYATFEDFLGTLRSESRKQIRKERRRIGEQGVTCELRRGDELGDEEWRTLYQIYRSTTDRKWGSPYMTEAFFEQAKGAVGRDALVGLARREGRIIAGQLSYQRGAHVYGRYWGALEYVDGLHFELCYYQLIDYAIAARKQLVEAGAQGEHKLKRGFVPTVVHSAHHIEDLRLRAAVERFIRHETAELEEALPSMQRHTPFRSDSAPKAPPIAGVTEEEGGVEVVPLAIDDR